MRSAGRVLAALALLAWAGAAARAAPPSREHEARVLRALLRDADEVRRLAKWGDESGLPRTADADWQYALLLDSSNEAVRKRLGWVRRAGAWTRDEATYALQTAAPDARPDLRPAYAQRRAAVLAESALRWREVAAAAHRAGLVAQGDRALWTVLTRNPDDAWARLALGQTLDPEEGWLSPAVRARREAEARAAAAAALLRERASVPTQWPDLSPRSAAAQVPLAVYGVREWRVETDLPPEGAGLALEGADLAARWFRRLVGLPPAAPVLPAGCTFVVLSTVEAYDRVVDAEPGLSAAERQFGKRVSVLPVAPEKADDPRLVIVYRPDDLSAADACLHYAVHLLAQAWAGVQSTQAWLYEGLAAYAGIRLAGRQNTWCVQLEATSAGEASADRPDPVAWASEAAALLSGPDAVPARALFGASLNGLDLRMLIQSWSLVRWLVDEHPDEARALLAAMRAGAPPGEAFRVATGMTPEVLDVAWPYHLLETEGL